MHWSSGSFGYFPTYSLGNVIAAQPLGACPRGDARPRRRAEGGASWNRFAITCATASIATAASWLGAQMVERATGGPLDPEPLLRHLREKFGEIYGLGAAASSDTA